MRALPQTVWCADPQCARAIAEHGRYSAFGQAVGVRVLHHAASVQVIQSRSGAQPESAAAVSCDRCHRRIAQSVGTGDHRERVMIRVVTRKATSAGANPEPALIVHVQRQEEAVGK